ncbi:hypothetical protein LCGC14_1993340 [marine sediment metagenome]|uniref:Glycosyltransferase 2-like domain-containing protein n=1 Tax=marine sediment metagenome TaxID=412755 RepID=A0A0F9I2K8_9ZZZZ
MTKNVTMVIPFRDNGDDVIRLFNALWELDWPPENFRIVAVEGDSVDDTYPLLKFWETDFPQFDKVTLIKLDLNVPQHPSSVHPERFYALATTYNAGLDAAVEDDWTDFVFLIPSDLRFSPDVVSRLVAHNKHHIAPMYWIQLGEHIVFYDTWGFRNLDGHNWNNFRRGQWNNPIEPFQMAMAGGPVMLRRDVLDAGCRYTVEEVDNGLCKMIWEKGFSVWCDPNTDVYHAPRS